jgi:RNA polymerase sigma factor (sigma-70 family)
MQKKSSFSDAELVKAIKEEKNIDEAIEFIYREYYGLLESYVRKNSGTSDDAADIFQEVLLGFIELVKQEKFRGQASIKSFLYTLTRNLWITELRKRNSAFRRHEQFQGDQTTMESDVSEYLVYKEHQTMIISLLNELSDTCREILRLFYYENLSLKEILAKMPRYQNEQVVRNKKYKCLKEISLRVKNSPVLRENLKTMSRHVK